MSTATRKRWRACRPGGYRAFHDCCEPSPPSPCHVGVVDAREAVKEIAHRAEELAGKGLRGKEFLRSFGIDEEEEPSVTITTVGELDDCFASADRCAPSS